MNALSREERAALEYASTRSIVEGKQPAASYEAVWLAAKDYWLERAERLCEHYATEHVVRSKDAPIAGRHIRDRIRALRVPIKKAMEKA